MKKKQYLIIISENKFLITPNPIENQKQILGTPQYHIIKKKKRQSTLHVREKTITHV